MEMGHGGVLFEEEWLQCSLAQIPQTVDISHTTSISSLANNLLSAICFPLGAWVPHPAEDRLSSEPQSLHSFLQGNRDCCAAMSAPLPSIYSSFSLWLCLYLSLHILFHINVIHYNFLAVVKYRPQDIVKNHTQEEWEQAQKKANRSMTEKNYQEC